MNLHGSLYGIGFWLPSLIKASGIASPATIGWLVAIPYSAAVVCMILTSRHSDRTGERRWHIAIPALVGATALVVSTFVPQTPLWAIVTLSVASMGILTGLSQFWVLPPAFLGGAAAAAGIALRKPLHRRLDQGRDRQYQQRSVRDRGEPHRRRRDRPRDRPARCAQGYSKNRYVGAGIRDSGAELPHSFEAFQAEALAGGCDEALVREWWPDTVLETHTHPFDAEAIIVQGEM